MRMMSSGTIPKMPMTNIAGATRDQRVRMRWRSRSVCTVARRSTLDAAVTAPPLVLEHSRRARRHVDADAVADGEMRLAAERVRHAHAEVRVVGEPHVVVGVGADIDGLLDLAGVAAGFRRDLLGPQGQRNGGAGNGPGDRRDQKLESAGRTATHKAPALAVDRRGDEVRVADEIRDETVDRLLVDLHRDAELLDLAVAHDRDAVAHGERLFLVMGHEDE